MAYCIMQWSQFKNRLLGASPSCQCPHQVQKAMPWDTTTNFGGLSLFGSPVEKPPHFTGCGQRQCGMLVSPILQNWKKVATKKKNGTCTALGTLVFHWKTSYSPTALGLVMVSWFSRRPEDAKITLTIHILKGNQSSSTCFRNESMRLPSGPFT